MATYIALVTAIALLVGFTIRYLAVKRKTLLGEEEKYQEYKKNRDLGAPEDPTIMLLNMDFYPQRVPYPAERRYQQDKKEERFRRECEEKHARYEDWLRNRATTEDEEQDEPPEDEIVYAGDVYGWDDLDDMGSDEPF